MALTEQLKDELDALIKNHDVVLFMKGTPQRPQCGFSATVVEVLDEHLDGYRTVNVLERADIREGIKEYANWPTIPQLFVRGEFVGGADIVRSLVQKGELASVLGVTPKELAQPSLTVTPAARAQLEAALEGEGGTTLRFSIDKRFQYGLEVDGPQPGDFSYPLGKVTLLLDRGSAKRAEGVVIDFVERGNTSGFKIDNPSAPPTVKPLSPRELKAKLDASEKLELFDVRTVEERQLAAIGGARLLDAHVDAHIRTLPKDTTLVFHCHHGGRSAAAAQRYVELGYKNVYNLEGGIAAWSRDVDPSVPQY